MIWNIGYGELCDTPTVEPIDYDDAGIRLTDGRPARPIPIDRWEWERVAPLTSTPAKAPYWGNESEVCQHVPAEVLTDEDALLELVGAH